MCFFEFPELGATAYFGNVLVDDPPIYYIMYLYCPHYTKRSFTLPTLRHNDVLLEDWSKSPCGIEETAIARYDRCKRCDTRKLEQSKATVELWAMEEFKRLKKPVEGETNGMTDEKRHEKATSVLKISGIHIEVLETLFQKKWSLEDGMSQLPKSRKGAKRTGSSRRTRKKLHGHYATCGCQKCDRPKDPSRFPLILWIGQGCKHHTNDTTAKWTLEFD